MPKLVEIRDLGSLPANQQGLAGTAWRGPGLDQWVEEAPGIVLEDQKRDGPGGWIGRPPQRSHQLEMDPLLAGGTVQIEEGDVGCSKRLCCQLVGRNASHGGPPRSPGEARSRLLRAAARLPCSRPLQAGHARPPWPTGRLTNTPALIYY